MPLTPIALRVGEAPDIHDFLTERIHEYNARVTGHLDAEDFTCTQCGESGDIRAGICGYTWGGCCYIAYLWVHEAERGHGVGAALLAAAEEHAKTRRCGMVFLTTHSFQAPAFYERMGYEARVVLADHPVGHASAMYVKRLRSAQPAGQCLEGAADLRSHDG